MQSDRQWSLTHYGVCLIRVDEDLKSVERETGIGSQAVQLSGMWHGNTIYCINRNIYLLVVLANCLLKQKNLMLVLSMAEKGA